MVCGVNMKGIGRTI